MKADPTVGDGFALFKGDEPHIGAVGKGGAEIVDIGFQKGFFVRRRGKCFPFTARR